MGRTRRSRRRALSKNQKKKGVAFLFLSDPTKITGVPHGHRFLYLFLIVGAYRPEIRKRFRRRTELVGRIGRFFEIPCVRNLPAVEGRRNIARYSLVKLQGYKRFLASRAPNYLPRGSMRKFVRTCRIAQIV